MKTVTLDTRTQEEIFATALELARTLTPEWAAGFPTVPTGSQFDDPGLAMLQLFGELHVQLNGPLNAVSNKYQLAFWDFMGITLRPPKAAEAPIWFQLKGTTPATVAKGTQISSSVNKSVVFETTSDLPLLPATVSAAYSVRPEADAYSDYCAIINGTDTPFPLFADDPNQQPIVHAMFLSDPNLNTGDTVARLTLNFGGVNLARSYFSRWSAADGSVMTPVSLTQSFDQLTAVFALEEALPSGTVNGQSGQWIKVMPAEGVRILPFLENSLPRIFIATATIDIAQSPADAAFFNATPIDLKKGGYPFGKMPAVEDAFYIASKASFSKLGAELTLNFDLQSITPPEQAILVWEYWDGSAWASLSVRDETRNLTTSGTVTFLCPQVIETKINKVNNYWIRVRIETGGYGSAQGRLVTLSAEQVVDTVLAPYVTNAQDATQALQDDNIEFGYVFKPASYTPPYISKLSIDSSITFGPQNMLAQNGFTYAPFAHQPYMPEDSPTPLFYLGFATDGFEASVLGQDLTLYIAFENEDPSLLPTASSQTTAMTLGFEYFDGNSWQPMNVAKLAGNYQSEGIMVLQMPRDMVTQTQFGETLYWIRITPPSSNTTRLSPIRGIYPNCVAAFNAVSWQNVILGSAKGEPAQSFTFPHAPVLAGPVIQVLETVPGGSGSQDVEQEWITWTEVSNFDFASPLDRCYTLEHESGVLTFGDGVHGMVPPKGARNVRAARYKSGGGVSGNCPAGQLNRLKTANGAVQAVQNVEAALGGVDADQISELYTRAPAEVRAGDRAITASDFQALAVTASQQVVQAAVNTTTAGQINLVVLPNYPGATPLPSYDLRNLVGTYLSNRAVPLAAPMINVGGPSYEIIDVQVNVLLTPGTNQDQAYQALVTILQAYLMPLTGGKNGQGWQFGDTLRASDLAQAFSNAPGIEMIDGLSLNRDLQFVALDWDQLPTAGLLKMEVVDADSI